MKGSGEGHSQLTASWLFMISDTVSIFVAALAIFVVHEIDRRQTVRLQQLQ